MFKLTWSFVVFTIQSKSVVACVTVPIVTIHPEGRIRVGVRSIHVILVILLDIQRNISGPNVTEPVVIVTIIHLYLLHTLLQTSSSCLSADLFIERNRYNYSIHLRSNQNEIDKILDKYFLFFC